MADFRAALQRSSRPPHNITLAWKIEPRTEIGEATVQLLRLNAPDRVLQRLALQQIGVYPAS